jgi:4-diphosphocytidyl-2-C-methyl-D-erythritol kinase
MADLLTLHARAKINLHLRVLGRLPGGYHALETVYHSVDLSDTLTFSAGGSGVTVECDDDTIPTGPDNLVARAADAFFRFTGTAGGLRASIKKRIPAGAGLGGGSADAAATLVALNRLYETRYPVAVLERLGASVGADVPFCIRGGAAWGFGIGTELTPLEPLTGLHALVVNPGIHVDTTSAYRALKARPVGHGPGMNPTAAGAAILRAWREAAPAAVNSFEEPVFAAHRAVRELRDRLRAHGAAAMMTGSGSTVFGVFQDAEALAAARSAMSDQPFVVVTSFAGCGVVDARPS